jgi:hypothetical protein
MYCHLICTVEMHPIVIHSVHGRQDNLLSRPDQGLKTKDKSAEDVDEELV